jgi:hypothetical protein
LEKPSAESGAGQLSRTSSGVGKHVGALEHGRRGDEHEALDVVVERGAYDGVVQRVVDLEQAVVGPAGDGGEVDDVRAALHGLAGSGQ